MNAFFNQLLLIAFLLLLIAAGIFIYRKSLAKMDDAKTKVFPTEAKTTVANHIRQRPKEETDENCLQ